jgi:hypothetical protein
MLGKRARGVDYDKSNHSEIFIERQRSLHAEEKLQRRIFQLEKELKACREILGSTDRTALPYNIENIPWQNRAPTRRGPSRYARRPRLNRVKYAYHRGGQPKTLRKRGQGFLRLCLSMWAGSLMLSRTAPTCRILARLARA